eukprot:10424818-Lingulodinium_polyedra.AAC.1
MGHYLRRDPAKQAFPDGAGATLGTITRNLLRQPRRRQSLALHLANIWPLGKKCSPENTTRRRYA